MPIKLNTEYLFSFIKDEEFYAIESQVNLAHNLLQNRTGLGNNFTGWLTLPTDYDREEFDKIKVVSKKIISNTDIFIVIGVGGSYLGARAAIELVHSQYYNDLSKKTPEIYFIGNSLSSTALYNILKICDGKDVSINVISKSGTTIEPAIAFRTFKNFLEKKYGKKEAKNRIFCTTDRQKGPLKAIADEEGYETFVIPDNIGGRFSVLTAVGLLPMAVSGIDIDELILGAKLAQDNLFCNDLNKNDCYKYAAIRNILYRKGKHIEIFASYEPDFLMLNEWLKQLFGESEGKDNKGIFPTSAIFSTDLHSIGQYLQCGRRNLFETVFYLEKPQKDVIIEEISKNVDGLNFLTGKSLSFVNEKAFLGTVLAHTDGCVPNVVFKISEVNPFELGYLFYFFEKACAISSYILGVNPFDQPGVEKYKNNMFDFLKKPGYVSY